MKRLCIRNHVAGNIKDSMREFFIVMLLGNFLLKLVAPSNANSSLNFNKNVFESKAIKSKDALNFGIRVNLSTCWNFH